MTALPADILEAARTLWDFHLVYDEPEPCDAIIGLGSYDTRVAARCADLFHKGMAPVLVFTGHSGNWTKGLFPTSEAAAFAEVAAAKGVPADAILLEESATNIGENMRFSAALFGKATPSVLIVTKPQTQKRVLGTVRKQWPEARARITAPLVSFEEQPTPAFPLDHLIREMVGDVRRIRDYPALGFQVPLDVPDEVIAAWRRLVEAGYGA